LVLPGWIENLDWWASSRMIFLISGSTGTTRRFPNQTASWWSFWKQVYLGSPSASFCLMVCISSHCVEQWQFYHKDWTLPLRHKDFLAVPILSWAFSFLHITVH
jgi:hypothetical protein